MSNRKRKVCVVVGASSKWQANGVSTKRARQVSGFPVQIPRSMRFTVSALSSVLDDDEFVDETKWGVGGAICLRFAREGFAVALFSRKTAENVIALADAVKRAGGEPLPVECELGDEQSIKNAFATVVQELGPVDVLVYNAGYTSGGASEVLVEDLPTEIFDVSMSVQCRGAFLCCKEVLPHMREQGEGTVLFSSVPNAMRGGIKNLTNSTAKAALRGLSQSLNAEYHPLGIHVAHIVINGFIDSPGTRPLVNGKTERMMDPAAIAETYWQLHAQHKSAWSYETVLTNYLGSISPRL